MENGDIASWVATGIAFVSMLFSIWASNRAKQEQELAARHQREAAELMEKRHELDQLVWVDQYFVNVREWANQGCLAISEAIHLIRFDALDKTSKRNVQTKLSALIDSGRWYFPNQWKDEYGIKKEPAYRGLRQRPLDCLVFVYDLLEKGDTEPEQLKTIQRNFVSEIQKVLDPRIREQRIEKVLEEFRQSEQLRTADDN